jgi:hypothetical protein
MCENGDRVREKGSHKRVELPLMMNTTYSIIEIESMFCCTTDHATLICSTLKK